MLTAFDVAKVLCRKADKVYLAALFDGQPQIEAAGINTPLRLAHFLAQIFHETGGLTVLRENMKFSAKRIQAVWPTRPEAVRYAGNPEGLANSVYANRMGNGPPSSGDGFRYRGHGFMQTTGKSAFAKYGKRMGVDLVSNPDLILDPRYALMPALFEWQDMGCNALADRNAIKQIGNAINRGNPNSQAAPIGHLDRVEWFNKIWALLQKKQAAPAQPSWEAAEPDPDIELVQKALVELGYEIKIDGRKGPKTEKAIRSFQASKNIPVDGVAGSVTRAALVDAVKALNEDTDRAPKPATANPPVVKDATSKGVTTGVLVAAGEGILQQTEKLEPVAQTLPDSWSVWVRGGLALLGVGAVLLIAYGTYRTLRPRAGRAK